MAEEKRKLSGQQKIEAFKWVVQALQAAPGAIKPGRSGEDFAEDIIDAIEKLGDYIYHG